MATPEINQNTGDLVRVQATCCSIVGRICNPPVRPGRIANPSYEQKVACACTRLKALGARVPGSWAGQRMLCFPGPGPPAWSRAGMEGRGSPPGLPLDLADLVQLAFVDDHGHLVAGAGRHFGD